MTIMDNPDWHLPDPHSQAEFYADVPLKRFFAWLIDTVIVLLITLLAVVLTGFVGLLVLLPLAYALNFAYRVITIARKSATPGMRLMAIEFRNARGQHLDLGEAVLHTAGFTLCVSFPLLQLGSIILMATSERGQGLPDMALGTVALNRRAGA